jgi:HD-like signal output (HDOD) protein
MARMSPPSPTVAVHPAPPGASDDDLARSLRDRVLGDIQAGTLSLPSPPAVVSRCLVLLSNPAFAVSEVASLIESDPTVAARLIRLCNSPAFLRGGPPRAIGDCVTRLGARELRIFLFETAARELFQSRDARIRDLCACIWEHSVAVGVLARMLMGRGTADGEAAYLAGLLHDIGKPVLANALLDLERRLEGRVDAWLAPRTWLALVRAGHRPVGRLLADRWGLPPASIAVLRGEANLAPARGRTLENAVLLANALAKREGYAPEKPDHAQLEQIIATGQAIFAMDGAAVDHLLDALREQVGARAS